MIVFYVKFCYLNSLKVLTFKSCLLGLISSCFSSQLFSEVAGRWVEKMGINSRVEQIRNFQVVRSNMSSVVVFVVV